MNPDFWLRLAVASLVIIGIWNAFGPGMILSRAGDWFEKHAPTLGKPIGLCPPCMASLHGTWIWLVTGGRWIELPIFILALSGAMVLITKTFLRHG